MKDFALGIGVLLFGLVGTIALARTFLAVVTVRDESMQPTLLEGDRVLVLRHWPSRWLRRGQIVLVWPGEFPDQGPQPFGVPEPFVERLFGMPGDTFAVYADQEDRYFLQNEQLYAGLDWRLVRPIPDQHLFVYGDNPLASLDSRTWGPIPFESVLGLVVLKLGRRRVARSTAMLSISASVDSAAR
jgi:signal peptidase I